MVASYQPKTRDSATHEKTSSQSIQTNMSAAQATVAHVLESKSDDMFWIAPEESCISGTAVSDRMPSAATVSTRLKPVSDLRDMLAGIGLHHLAIRRHQEGAGLVRANQLEPRRSA